MATIKGDGHSLYLVDIIAKPASESYTISYLEDYNTAEIDQACSPSGNLKEYKCKGDKSAEYFSARLKMNQASGEIINSVTLNVRSENERCDRSYDTCSADGTVKSENANNFCLGFLGCFPKMACYIGIAVFVVCAIGIVLTVYRRNHGSGDIAALDRPNTNTNHLGNEKRESRFNFNKWRSNSNNSSNKETLIQFDEIPIESKEAGKTPWLNKKSSLPMSNNIGSGLGSGSIGLGSNAGLGLGSGSLGSNGALLPQSSVVKVHNDPGAGTGLKHTRSVKRAPSSKHVKREQSTRKPSNRLTKDDSPPPLPSSYEEKINSHDYVINMNQPSSPPTYKQQSLNRTKSARSTRSTKSVKKPRAPVEGSSSTTRKQSTRHQPRHYQIPSDSESSSDSDNEVLGLRAKPSMKRIGGSSPNSSIPYTKEGNSRKKSTDYHSSSKGSPRSSTRQSVRKSQRSSKRANGNY